MVLTEKISCPNRKYHLNIKLWPSFCDFSNRWNVQEICFIVIECFQSKLVERLVLHTKSNRMTRNKFIYGRVLFEDFWTTAIFLAFFYELEIPSLPIMSPFIFSQYVYLQFTIVILRPGPVRSGLIFLTTSGSIFLFLAEIIDRHALVEERLE